MTRKIILDTDPGVDDVVAMALAFMTPPNDSEIALITPVFGNTSLFHTVRNTVTILNIIDQEREWRKKNGYRQPRSDTPLVAMGAEGPIDGSKIIDARFFHGKDGIAEVHSSVTPMIRAAIDNSTLTLHQRIMRGVRSCKIRHDISSHLRILHTSKY